MDHHSLGYSYDSDPPITMVAAVTAAAVEEQRTRIVASKASQIKRVIPLFPLVKEIRALSPSRRTKKKGSKSIGTRKKKKTKRSSLF